MFGSYLTTLIFNFSLCFARDLNIEDCLSENKSIYENNDLIVYSNYGYTEKEMIEIIDSSDKQCLFFEKDINPLNGCNLFGAIDNICFSYKMNYDESTTYDFDTLKKDCNDYFLYVLSASRTNNACQYLLFEINGNSCFRTDFALNYEFDAIYAQRNDLGFKLGTRELKFSNTKQIGSYYL